MKGYTLVFVLVFFISLPMGLHAQRSDSLPAFSDGPYLFYNSDGLTAKWINAGTLREKSVEAGDLLEIEANGKKVLQLEQSFTPDPVTSYQGVGKVAVISDIHGQYDLMTGLLQAHQIIDASNNWTYGKGHLVVAGDIFDRGDQVTEILWLVHGLEKQAAEAGGKVHFILGNHEIMVLQADLRYIHKKYRYTTAMLGLPYHKLYGPDTYLGRWLRSRPVAISINETVFVHAGFSEPLLQLGLSFEQLNTIFREEIIDRNEDEILADSILNLLYLDYGPVWYRGYFEEGFSKKRAKNILKKLGKKHIVVGHTSFPEIISLHRRKVIGVDSSIKLGEKGEILIVEDGKFYRGNLKGEREKLR